MSYVGKVYRQEPETRWFRRYVLGRKCRSTLIHAGLLDNFTLERNLNGISNAAFVLRDPLESLMVTPWGPDHPSYDEMGQ